MLTDIQVKSSKLTLKGETKTLTDNGGLLLYITHTGKYWRIRYRFHGTAALMSIGEYPIVSLLEARQKQMEIKKLLHDGKNPIAERKKVSEWTFEKVARLWLANWQTDKSVQHVNIIRRRLEVDIFPKIGAMPIDEVTTVIIVNLVKGIALRGALDVANRTLQKFRHNF
ncbi:MAG: hypothetical protein QG673_1051 [Pseudomonadota bacterium]|nr:hypothetical protein [Pseudomonadota bacterium]